MSPVRHDHEEIRDDLAAYALGALPEDEAAALEKHLEGCESCRARLLWLRPAVDVLPATVEQRTPPERLRENLLATVRAEAGQAEAERAASRQPEPVLARKPTERRSWWRPLERFALTPAAGFATVLLVAVGIASGYALRGDDGAGEPVSESIAAVPLGGSEALASATLERHGDSATLHVHELPKLARDEVYEVWIRRAGVMEPASVFVLGADGTGEAAVPGSLEGADAVLVSKEPRPGSQQPTSEPLLEAPL